MYFPRNKNTNPTQLIGDALNLEDGVVHLTQLLFHLSVVSPSLCGVLHPLVTVLALGTTSATLGKSGWN